MLYRPDLPMKHMQNVNTVDVIMPSWPAFLYTSPKLGRFLLEGLFRYQATGQYPNKWSVHDLGANLHQIAPIFYSDRRRCMQELRIQGHWDITMVR